MTEQNTRTMIKFNRTRVAHNETYQDNNSILKLRTYAPYAVGV